VLIIAPPKWKKPLANGTAYHGTGIAKGLRMTRSGPSPRCYHEILIVFSNIKQGRHKIVKENQVNPNTICRPRKEVNRIRGNTLAGFIETSA